MENTARKEYDEWYAKEVGVLGTLQHKAWLTPWLASRKKLVVTLAKVEMTGSWHFFGFINGWKLGQHVVRRADAQAIRNAGLTVEFCEE